MHRLFRPLCVVAFFTAAASALALPPSTVVAAPGSTARVLPIASDGFSGSSVNVIANLQNAIVTESRTQYAAFYAADSTLVLARRVIGQDAWETSRTQYKGNTADAHHTIAIAVDGAGILHVAWSHHGNALNYTRSVAPGLLELGPQTPMTGAHEDRVTYPAFLRHSSGDLLFTYRDGASGRGNLVLNRYTTASRTWRQIHASLIDGEGQRSAYPSTYIDHKGNIHLAWNWRDSADVATNHDIAYARSADGGQTWTTSTGAALTLPITAATADYALRIPTGRSLMNPPTVTADPDGNPLIADYWTPEGSDIPQYHLLRYHGKAWQVSQVTQRKTPFELKGTATKRPPLSRAAVFARKAWRKPPSVYLVYRDDERAGRITVATCKDVAVPEWSISEITADTVGAWEPSADPVQWQRFQQVHLLVQPVDQQDGNDRIAATTPATTVSSLIWSPFLVGMVATPAGPDFVNPAGYLDAPLVPREVYKLATRAADYWLSQPPQKDPAGWENAPFYIGALELAKISPSPKYHDTILAIAQSNQWKPARRLYNADDYCITQAYVELYRKHRDPKMIEPSRAAFDEILKTPANVPLDWELPRALDRWSWCDALFMGPASWLMMADATGDKRYIDFVLREWQATTDALYIKGDALYARDESFLDLREPNGRRLYWARGNGWVVAGLCRTIDALPKNHPAHAQFKAQYLEMMDTILAAQQPNGLWRPGLLDSVTHTARETSGSSFNTFALAWGVNRGWLDHGRLEPAIRRAWHALAGCVNAEGRLEHVQPVGAAPEGFDPHHTEPFGVGAFLLASCEVYRMFGGETPASP